MKAILTMLLAGAVACMAFGAYEGAIGFQAGHGAKALGMGGAFTALADDGTAALWNPSGLIHADDAWITGATTNTFGLFPNQYVAGGMSLADYSLAVGWGNIADDVYSANMFMGSVAMHLAEIVGVGVNVKYYMEGYEGDLDSGFGFDIGLGMHVTDEFVVGIMAQDVGGVTLVEGETISPAYVAGMGVTLLEGALTLATDVKLAGDDIDICMGLDVQLIENLAIRGGLVLPEMDFDQSYFSLGAGVAFAGLNIDAAYILYEDVGNSLVLSATFSFAELLPEPEPEPVETPPED
ncbi:MAG: hypothetical protein R6U88_03125 [Candidatus Bipolaricaulota bacterium]